MVVMSLEPSDVGYGVSSVKHLEGQAVHQESRRCFRCPMRPMMFLIDAHLDLLLLLILMFEQFFSGLEGF